MEVVDLDSRELRTASFAARLHRLRVAYRNGAVRDFTGVSHGLFSALAKSGDPDAFLRDRVDGVYPAKDIIRAA
jgi:hypothetical protein